jgi:hypothetical protein
MEQTDGTGQEKSRNARLGDPKSNSGDSQSNRDEASESRQMEYVNAEPEGMFCNRVQGASVLWTTIDPPRFGRYNTRVYCAIHIP